MRSLLLKSFVLAHLLGAGCEADGAPIEGDLVVSEAGLASPVPIGTQCQFRLRPAWRQGVDCQLLVTCPPTPDDEDGEDLFGGRRVGGYASCQTEDHAFTRALDGQYLDGDPAIDLDLRARRLDWQGNRPGQTATLVLVGETRPTVWIDE